VGSGRPNKRTALAECIRERGLDRVDEAAFGELMRVLAPVSESHLRHLLRDTGLDMGPLVEGVRQESEAELERTLIAMEHEYSAALACGDAPRAKACRRAVITAKDHARFSMKSPRLEPERRALKQEMLLWMLTWLENPGVFPEWVELRKANLTAETQRTQRKT
jgi:hypothetical protein